MDQRVKGGSPPSTASLLDSVQDQVTEKKRRVEAENGDMGTKEEDKRGIGKVREGENGEVLELLIKGRCGTVGQQQLQISGRETSCPEGNVRVRIGLQTKRTKKPPKILESYVCKPTIRTYQRQSRSALMRGDGIGKTAQQSKNSSASSEATREQRSCCDAGQAKSKQTTSSSSPPHTSSLPSSSSQPDSLPTTVSTASTPDSALTITSQGTKVAKQVPIKPVNQTEGNSNSSSEKVKKDKLLSVNGQHIPAEPSSCSPTSDRTASNGPPTQCAQTLSALEHRNDTNASWKHKGLVQTTKQTRLSKSKKSANILGNSSSSKNKACKDSSSSVSYSQTASSKSYTQLSISSKVGPDVASYPSVTPKPQLSPTADLSSAFSQSHDPSLLPPIEKKREKAKKIKKEKRKEKKLKQDKLEAKQTKGENTEEVKKKKKEKGKDLKLRHKEKRRSTDDTKGQNINDKELTEKKKETLSPEGQRNEDNKNCEETSDIVGLDKVGKLVNSARVDEKEKNTDSYKPAKQAVTTTGDSSKSKEKDFSRHSTVSSIFPSLSAPPNLPSSYSHDLLSPPLSTQEQDSRPLKKRKARRPSWTKLHRGPKADNQEAHSSDLLNNPVVANFPQNLKTPLSTKTTVQQSDESHPGPSSSLTSNSSPLFSVAKPLTPDQSPPTTDSSPPAYRCPANPVQKRGRPKFSSSSSDTPPPRLSPNDTPTELPLLGSDEAQKAPVLDPNPAQQSPSSPKKRGRPPKRSLTEDQHEDASIHTNDLKRNDNPRLFEKGNHQQKIRRLINEMKKRKKRLYKVSLPSSVEKSGEGGIAADGEISMASTVHTLSALSSFGSKHSPQINVSKKGTIYMGKRRGRKPKSQKTTVNCNVQSSTFPSLFTSPPETSFFTSAPPQPPPPHPFPSPSLTHSSGAQSPYSEGSLTEPTSTLLFSQPFSLPSPSSSCTSPRPPSSSSFSTFVKKSCPCQGRHHFPFHQSSCKLSSPTLSLHHTPGSPGHLKEATPSPRSESHSEETLPSDSGIGTDNNSVSEWVERRGTRSLLGVSQRSGLIRSSQKQPSSLADCHSTISSSISCMPRHTKPMTNSNTLERHRDKYRCKRRDYDCHSSCSCLCPCPGHKCTHPDCYSSFGNNATKRQKNKHKKKHQQLQIQDPEFLAELEDLLVQFSEVHIGRRSWARAGMGQSFDVSSNAVRGRRHHSSPHSVRSNIFRINLNGFYSPHPSPLPTNPSFTPKSFYACHCSRKPDRRQCSCPGKFQETIENLGFYSSYSPATTLYHLPNSYPLPSSYQFASHQPHHAHFLLNPARFNRHRGRLLREGALEEELVRDIGRNSAGDPHHGSGNTSSLFSGCGRSKHKHRHRHCGRQLEEEDLQDDEEEDGMAREGLAGSKARAGVFLVPGDGGRKGASRTVLSKDSPWLCENGKNSFSVAASSSSSTVDRYKHTSLTSPGLGSSHLSSFGGGWGRLNQSWTKLGAMGFGQSTPSWKSFSSDQQEGSVILSNGEDDDSEDGQVSPQHRASPSPTHTNLFTSVAIASGGRGLGTGLADRNTGSSNRSRTRDEPSWRHRGNEGLQGYSRSWGQQKRVPTPTSIALKNKRRPGRPRKHPLPSAVPFSTHSAALTVSPSPDFLPGHISRRDVREAEGRERERGGRAAVGQQVTDCESQTRKKRGRKRKHGDSPCHQSLAEDKPDQDSVPQCISQSGIEQAPTQPEAIQKEKVDGGPPRKTFLRAGLYSDDYKTTEPNSKRNSRESSEYTPGVSDYALLPAPIHVGKYLRLKRIPFQLPYDVMWLWQRNQLCRQPVVPLKRKRHYCRLKDRTVSSLQAAEENSSDITSFFPHLNMESLTSNERSFVMAHRVFLVRNWELTRDRQIRVRILRERERDKERDEQDSELPPTCDEASGEDSITKPGP
ncbi:histone-lysine N-methyltransferase ASH1L-like isoform X2 [Gouania willdenowi]|uniref:histone-lysine N-methyltransferase ASH1L-like isoform X2 n=1 Tax=Gouania willdenowi TaxID=441366 RepID=UPI001056A212|nr:histone-lysine N-methyltransferase ASH1L isoform X2 [Gouania willdenowi]